MGGVISCWQSWPFLFSLRWDQWPWHRRQRNQRLPTGIPLLGSRATIWVVAQIHLLLAGFVLGVPIFGLVCEIVGIKTGDKRHDNLAKEYTKLLTASFATTAMFGGVFLFSLIAFYPKFFNYMINVFWPTYVVYALLFVFETINRYLYWYGLDVMMNKKWLHITLGVCLNLAGFLIMIVTNAWLPL